MAYLGAQFEKEFDSVTPDSGYGVIEAGTYQLEIVKADLCDTKDGFGQYIKAQMKILAPKYQGRSIFKNFNIKNTSLQAEQIGRSQLKALTVACNIRGFNDTDQLLNIPFIADISIKKGNGTYGDQNDVKNFKILGKTPTISVQQEAKPQQTANANVFAEAFGGASQAATPPQVTSQQTDSKWDFNPTDF